MPDLYRCIHCGAEKPDEAMWRVNVRSATGDCKACHNALHWQYQQVERARWTPEQWAVHRAKRRAINQAYRARVGERVLRLRGVMRKLGLSKERA